LTSRRCYRKGENGRDVRFVPQKRTFRSAIETSGAPAVINETGDFVSACGWNQVIFLPHRSRSSRSTAMLLRLLRLLVLAAAPVVLLVSPARAAPEKVPYTGDAKAGTIVIQSEERSLYLVTGKDQALKYTVGVGRSGMQWFGTTRIASKHI